MDTPLPADRRSGLAGLHLLEWRHDGKLPAEALAALWTSETERERRRAEADDTLVDRLALGIVRARAGRRTAAMADMAGTAPHDHAQAAALDAWRDAGLALRLGGPGPLC